MPKHGDQLQEGRLREDFHANPIWESDEERKKRNESEIIVPIMKVITILLRKRWKRQSLQKQGCAWLTKSQLIISS